MTRTLWTGAAIFDGETLHAGAGMLCDAQGFVAIVSDPPRDAQRITLDGGTILPGFVDLQVNGGGGVMFNTDTTVAGLRRIAAAHASVGTRAFLPTLITDTPEKTRDAIAAVRAAIDDCVPGIVGLHLEGPHLSVARKGAHDPALIRAMNDDDTAQLCDAARHLPNLMVTLAPENATPDRIAQLARAGVIVSLGHSDCTYDEAKAAIAAGAVCVTHLFNAMSQLGNRAPGLVGAALGSGAVSAGLIADAIHVHPATIAAALRAKRGPGEIFLVTDAMATVGSEIDHFTLNGRRVLRGDGRLTLSDGTLAGADLDLPRALSVMIGDVGIDPAAAMRMVTAAPASLLRDDLGFGRFRPGRAAHAIHLDRAGQVQRL